MEGYALWLQLAVAAVSSRSFSRVSGSLRSFLSLLRHSEAESPPPPSPKELGRTVTDKGLHALAAAGCGANLESLSLTRGCHVVSCAFLWLCFFLCVCGLLSFSPMRPFGFCVRIM